MARSFQRLISLFICIIAAIGISRSQSEVDIHYYLDEADKGNIEAAQAVMPQLIVQYQNTPELAYLQGRVCTDGAEAMKYYQIVLDNYPKSPVAPPALYRSFEFYCSSGLYRRAQAALDKLKKDYPDSPLIAEAAKVRLPADDQAAPTAPEPARANDAAANSSTAQPTASPTPPPPSNSSPVVVTPQATVPPQAPPFKKFALQVGAFSTSANAAKQRSFFEKHGYPVETANKVLEDKTLFIVRVGSYTSADEARKAGAEIRRKFSISSMVVER